MGKGGGRDGEESDVGCWGGVPGQEIPVVVKNQAPASGRTTQPPGHQQISRERWPYAPSSAPWSGRRLTGAVCLRHQEIQGGRWPPSPAPWPGRLQAAVVCHSGWRVLS